METLLTGMGVVSIAILLWFVWGWVRGLVGKGKASAGAGETGRVDKDLY